MLVEALPNGIRKVAFKKGGINMNCLDYTDPSKDKQIYHYLSH